MKKQLINFARCSTITRRGGAAAEAIVFGTSVRESVLRLGLRQYFRSTYRRWWGWQPTGEPHFSLHNKLLFDLFEGTIGDGVYALTRAFFSAEVVQTRDVVLDIGCGDGSYTKRFYAPRAARVDGIDIEKSAVDYAQAHNAAANIRYQKLDATTDPFPSKSYNVVIFDGALGHFSRGDTDALLAKISVHLTPDGLFCGSESLGREAGHDHLQYFDTLDDLRHVLLASFKFVTLKAVTYHAGEKNDRVEAYWRCSNAQERLTQIQWT
ncbi:MAG TPA: class I SAM-dependent methyltransferase [Rhizomicrobium sp.]|nr:class I SAM-dependent methyltransferase [Rhizomicrobium sp.]